MGTSGGALEMQPGNGSAVNPDMAAMRAVYNRYFGFRYRSVVAAISGKLLPFCGVFLLSEVRPNRCGKADEVYTTICGKACR